MPDRLKAFIEKKGLSYSQFADMCGIPRPSLSQFVTGRNKKISDIMVGQIHNMFPELSIVWLLFGEGEMENTSKTSGESEQYAPAGSLFDDNLFSVEEKSPSDEKKIVFSGNRAVGGEISQGNRLKNGSEGSQITDISVDKLRNKIKDLQGQIEKMNKNPRKVKRIIVYYDDSTFEEFG